MDRREVLIAERGVDFSGLAPSILAMDIELGGVRCGKPPVRAQDPRALRQVMPALRLDFREQLRPLRVI
jgi:hypothetical protein